MAAAKQQSARTGVGVGNILIASGLITEEAYLVELAAELGVPFERLENVPRQACPLPDDRLIEAPLNGLLPLRRNGQHKTIVAPRLIQDVDVMRRLASNGDFPRRIALTSAARLQRFVAVHAGTEIVRRAVDGLQTDRPELSAGPRRRRSWTFPIAILLVLMAITAAVHQGYGSILEFGLGALFLAWTVLRLVALVPPRQEAPRSKFCADDRLPIYSVVVALHHETAAVKDLIVSLMKLDYPAAKLDVKLVLEADDPDTFAALTATRLPARFEIVTVPSIHPRTKPKALNAVLPFVRGAFVAVYDAEDRPEPDQLRLAYDTFLNGDRRLACIQARLTIHNSAESWITRLFAAEYASLFDLLLPRLASWRLPLPLGGSSNHFRTEILRKVGAWDPYNVTEDADLGMRLARLGYRTTMISSSTDEEAPIRFKPWRNQRTRWFKGWMQTVKQCKNSVTFR